MKLGLTGLSVLRTLGWLVGAGILVWELLALELEWNMFTWSPGTNRETVVCLLMAAAALGLTYLSALSTRDSFSHFVALILSVGLAVLAMYSLRPEPPSGGVFFGRTPSPLWYRAGRSVLLLFPLLLWAAFPMQFRRRGKDKQRENGLPTRRRRICRASSAILNGHVRRRQI